MIKIILSDGTSLTNISRNGDNFITNTAINDSIFKHKLSPVKIIEDDVETIHEHMQLIQIKQYGNEYWFILADISDEELERMQVRADLDFLAMMMNIDL